MTRAPSVTGIQAGNGLPDIGYATVYPVATIAKVLLAQIIWRLLA